MYAPHETFPTSLNIFMSHPRVMSWWCFIPPRTRLILCIHVMEKIHLLFTLHPGEIRRRFPERSCHTSLKLTAKVLQMGIKRTFHLPTTRCLGAKMLVSGKVRGFLVKTSICHVKIFQELPIIVIS